MRPSARFGFWGVSTICDAFLQFRHLGDGSRRRQSGDFCGLHRQEMTNGHQLADALIRALELYKSLEIPLRYE